jgi:hypothetical protein
MRRESIIELIIKLINNSHNNNNNNNNNKHAYAGQLNSFTHTRALLVLHARGILGPISYRRWDDLLVKACLYFCVVVHGMTTSLIRSRFGKELT